MFCKYAWAFICRTLDEHCTERTFKICSEVNHDSCCYLTHFNQFSAAASCLPHHTSSHWHGRTLMFYQLHLHNCIATLNLITQSVAAWKWQFYNGWESSMLSSLRKQFSALLWKSARLLSSCLSFAQPSHSGDVVVNSVKLFVFSKPFTKSVFWVLAFLIFELAG